MTESLEESRAQSRSQNDDHKYICPNCGYESNAKFCVKCGTALERNCVENKGNDLSGNKNVIRRITKKKMIIVSAAIILCAMVVAVFWMALKLTYEDTWHSLSYQIPKGLDRVEDDDISVEYVGETYSIKIFVYEGTTIAGTSDDWMGIIRSVLDNSEPVMIGGVSGSKGTSEKSIMAVFSKNGTCYNFTLVPANNEKVTNQQKEIFNKFLESVEIKK